MNENLRYILVWLAFFIGFPAILIGGLTLFLKIASFLEKCSQKTRDTVKWISIGVFWGVACYMITLVVLSQ